MGVMEGFVRFCDYEFKITDVSRRIVEGYASTVHVDRVNDIVVPSAFENCIESFLAKTPALLFNHNPNQVVGKITAAKIDENGLYVVAEIGKGWQLADEVWAMVKAGAVKGFSIGFVPKDVDYDSDIRIIKALDLVEISLTPIPTNTNAIFEVVEGKAVDVKLITVDYSHERGTNVDVKAVEPYVSLPIIDEPWSKRRAIKEIRRWASSDGSGDPDKINFNKYKKCFMYYDADRKEELTAYKLPFCYIVGGKPKAVRRAIFAIAVVLQGGRGGLNVPESDKAKIKKIVAAYYKKMGLKAPWEREKSKGQEGDMGFTSEEILAFIEETVDEKYSEIADELKEFAESKIAELVETKFADFSKSTDDVPDTDDVIDEKEFDELLDEIKSLLDVLKDE